ncbi:MAG TPA: GAF domain-containing protein [Gammaproteobacteria bacterium]|nr:GAF domain-containing protein [Gammaproteobacteria bacterium]
MHTTKPITTDDKAIFYAELTQQAQGLLHGEHDFIANAANFAALLYNAMPAVNWVGFYLLKDNELVVGPFQGQPACVRLALGKGVCGTAAVERRTQLVADVNQFAGHIACDAASQSEIVVPLIINDELIGVLDIDSPQTDRFDEEDKVGIEKLAEVFILSLG